MKRKMSFANNHKPLRSLTAGVLKQLQRLYSFDTLMKILSVRQIKELDAYTIKSQNIASIDLMERASKVFLEWFCKNFPDTDRPITIFCGKGNNGGDGLAIARLLRHRFYTAKVHICSFSKSASEDFNINKKRLEAIEEVIINEISTEKDLVLQDNDILIDAMFGSGLSRPISDEWKWLIERINHSGCPIVSVDIASGLFADQISKGPCVNASHTLSFEVPKLAFMIPENQNMNGRWEAHSIGLDAECIERMETTFYYTTSKEATTLLKQKNKFDHKGIAGNVAMMTGSHGKIGAAILSAKAALRAGCGLVTSYIPGCGYTAMQSALPEAMCVVDEDQFNLTTQQDLSTYDAIGIGCGISTSEATQKWLLTTLESVNKPVVLDADALNILSIDRSRLNKIPENAILTPHLKEFARMFGASSNHFERLERQREAAQTYNCVILLKGAHSSVALPDGNIHFNASGNPGMATAGSGDVLTGILAGLLAQGYTSGEAAILGCYLHGVAGDLAAKDKSQYAMIANDIIENIGNAYKTLINE